MTDKSDAGREFVRLQEILEKLRSPGGCPWDREQTKEDIAKYLLEEAYEVADAVAENSVSSIREELGDLLYQILFIADIAREDGQYDIMEVIADISAKMIRRHPHVFASLSISSVAEVKSNWVRIKNEVENRNGKDTGFFERLPRSQPALSRAQRITEKAALVGFDWQNATEVLEKIEEELDEFKEALKSGKPERLGHEAGDLIFSVMNLCRITGVEAEVALKEATERFISRFGYIEGKITGQGKTLQDASLEDMNGFWNEAKSLESGGHAKIPVRND
ncbi:MAG: nucleoside triphosphate pyrophosphohydrolase [Smithellaceae bacterium]|nr:nucleoside triphosphate pyrophosphohydrolase [Smithellaceae bacterium]